MNINHKFKYLLCKLISILPFNKLRCSSYRFIAGYTIGTKAFIERNTIIAVDEANIGNAIIRSDNTFTGPFFLTIQDGAKILSGNTISCPRWTLLPEHSYFRRIVKIGKDTLITNSHFIDASDYFELGENSWLAGRGSQFWTHGTTLVSNDISIGKCCYIGSAVRFAPGTSIGDYSIVGIGSVVTKKFIESYCMIAGAPARLIKNKYYWKTRTEV